MIVIKEVRLDFESIIKNDDKFEGTCIVVADDTENVDEEIYEAYSFTANTKKNVAKVDIIEDDIAKHKRKINKMLLEELNYYF